MERNNVVTNGCSGNCCEAFTFAYTVEDLKRNREALARGEFEFTNEQGFTKRVTTDNSIDTVIDMLIFKELTETDPQTGDNLTQQTIDFLTTKGLWEGSFETLNEKGKKIVDDRGLEIHGEKVLVKVFTCKHFDKDNKICTNYEGRPHLCKHNRADCKYKGCCFSEKYWKEYDSKED